MRQYQISGTDKIYSSAINGQVSIFTLILDKNNNNAELKPSQHPTIWKNIYPIVGYLTPLECQDYNNPNPNGTIDRLVRFFSLYILDTQGEIIREYQLPDDEFWFTTLDFAIKNDWK